MPPTRLLYLTILIEGYAVLACELLAIRQLIPFVGSGTETIAIVISAVLLPLAVGYHAGGRAYGAQFRRARARGRTPLSIRKMLLKNILSALGVLALGLSYPFMELFFGVLRGLGLEHRIPQAAVYSLLFLVYPVYLLGQTVPLVSNYFPRARLSELTGRMLFFSTAGSFLGSVFSTIILMSTIGVHATVLATLSLLALLTLLLARRALSFDTLLALLALSVAYALNGAGTLKTLGIVADNNYNTIAVKALPEQAAKLMIINRSISSKVAANEENMFPYLRYVERIFLRPLADAETPRDILVIGAGGFTLGLNDARNRYTFVDIDGQLKKVAEAHFLPEKLTPNKRFVPMAARNFVYTDKDSYDLIVLDAYTNLHSLPMECITQEFFEDVKTRLKPGGIVIANGITTPHMTESFSARYTNTFASVFPGYTRQVIGDFNPWATNAQQYLNALYIYYNRPEDRTVYTDDLNTYSFDR